MVDCADRDRIDEARQELHRIINDREMREAIILIFANKQDLPEGEYKEKYVQCVISFYSSKVKRHSRITVVLSLYSLKFANSYIIKSNKLIRTCQSVFQYYIIIFG